MEDLQHTPAAPHSYLHSKQTITISKSQQNPSAYAYRCRKPQWSCLRSWNFHPFYTFSMNEQRADLHLVWPKSFGQHKKRREKKNPKILKGLILAQQEELSETTHAATVFPVLCFLCPAAVPLLSMSQISNDRRVCAGCTKRACLWQLLLHLKLWMMGGLLGGWW